MRKHMPSKKAYTLEDVRDSRNYTFAGEVYTGEVRRTVNPKHTNKQTSERSHSHGRASQREKPQNPTPLPDLLPLPPPPRAKPLGSFLLQPFALRLCLSVGLFVCFYAVGPHFRCSTCLRPSPHLSESSPPQTPI